MRLRRASVWVARCERYNHTGPVASNVPVSVYDVAAASLAPGRIGQPMLVLVLGGEIGLHLPSGQ